MFLYIDKEVFRIDVLVNNAGVETVPNIWTDMTEEEWDKVMHINLKGP